MIPGIENVPNEEQVQNLKRLCRWLERLRKRWNDLYGDGDEGSSTGFTLQCAHSATEGIRTLRNDAKWE